jgi:RHS repeat-associated protein
MPQIMGTNNTSTDDAVEAGKERDTESGLDYFGARYYGSSMGRWMSPDWADNPEPVPYAELSNPQTLNLYSYVENNPLRSRDADGHTHQECAPDTMTTNKDGSYTVTAGACHDVPDWYNFGTRFMNWRQKQADAWNARIAAHAPPTPPKSNGLSAEDVATAMMGVVGAGRIRIKGPSSENILSRDATGKIHGDIPDHVPDGWTQEQLETAKGEIEESIQQRANEQTQYGEDGPHRARMQQEENLLKQVNSKLGGK